MPRPRGVVISANNNKGQFSFVVSSESDEFVREIVFRAEKIETFNIMTIPFGGKGAHMNKVFI